MVLYPKRTVVAMSMLLAGATSPALAYDLSDTLNLQLQAAPGNSWVQLNLNQISSVFTPTGSQIYATVGGDPTGGPANIIPAWSSYAWDSNSDQLLLFGGGHHNYAGNEVYAWSASNGQWSRMDLPSNVTQPNASQYPNYFTTVDGTANAPVGAHTYDTNTFLPAANRLMVFGGAAFDTGGAFVAQNPDGTFRFTGPYLFDPTKANANEVGGLTGSNACNSLPSITCTPAIGGEMWSNRDGWSQLGYAVSFINQTAANRVENGKDVIYVTAAVRDTVATNLFRYVVNDPNDPSKDTIQLVGAWGGSTPGWSTGTLDTKRNLYVRHVGDTFWFWNLNSGANWVEQAFTPTVAGAFSLPYGSAFDYDPLSDRYLMWAGGCSVYSLKAPDSIGTDGWTLSQDNTCGAGVASPTGIVDNGVFGKWHYISDLDLYIGLQGGSTGEIWAYKPTNWLLQADISQAPEPSSLPLIGLGLASLFWFRRQGFLKQNTRETSP